MENNVHFAYRELKVYQYAREYAKYVYGIIDQCFPEYEKYALGDQLRRASISITSNLAESTGRYSTKEQIHFIEISFGSLYETMSQLELSHDVGYITQVQLSEVEQQVSTIAKLMSGYRESKINLLRNSSTANNH